METTDKFPRTRAAFARYDAETANRSAVWRAAETNKDVALCNKMDADAWALVREAFAHDTAGINSRDHAMLIEHGDVAQLLRLYPSEGEQK